MSARPASDGTMKAQKDVGAEAREDVGCGWLSMFPR